MILNAAHTEAPPCFRSSASRLSTSRLATRSLSGVCTAATCWSLRRATSDRFDHIRGKESRASAARAFVGADGS
eukprot:3697700-Prymnesium_polylepis.1